MVSSKNKAWSLFLKITGREEEIAFCRYSFVKWPENISSWGKGFLDCN